ncbi:hypothetical protein [Paenibacillus tarimensis]|uniref:hypothetical protein n=1 Tax=Paenibacillus tarimensis TaxID=416012 RepID=UPI001F2B8B8E|nr:hypothetical protein [Paenibacillus tarimensis]MCF2945150.1 hypothetical protein [Paenibacillus tarimensis]
MSKKKLHVKEPVISTYTSYGCLFSIMTEDLWPWVFNNFIQIRYAHNWGIFAFDCHHLLLKNCPGIAFYDMPQGLAAGRQGRSMQRIITEAIDAGYYLYIYVDRYYISLSDSYKKQSFVHELFIYGYDLVKGTALAADNLLDGQFIFAEIPLEEIEQGYWKIEGRYRYWTDIRYLKAEKQFDSSINLEQIAAGLTNYLHSKPTFDLVAEQPFDYGFQALNKLFEQIEMNRTSAVKNLDRRGFHLLYEHKLLMELRLKYLTEHQGIPCGSLLLDSAAALKQDFLIVRNLVLKYNLKKDIGLLNHIRAVLETSIASEQRFISSLLNTISSMTSA